jgi:hypothetical protein
MNKCIAAAALLMAGACSPPSPAPHNETAAQHEAPAPPRPPKPVPPAAPQPAPTPPAVDPKSTDAAIALVQGFADLLNAGKFDEAYMLLGPSAPPRAEFDRRFASIAHIHVGVSTPGPQEGAAGSIYLSVPIEILGDDVRKSATMTLRRVNDVPGSTDAQRRWHIERIDWGSSG